LRASWERENEPVKAACRSGGISGLGRLHPRHISCHLSAKAAKLIIPILSQSSPMASSSSSKFKDVLDAALEAYEKTTKNKLLDHPLASQLQSCDSSATILPVLQDLVQQFDRSRSGDERLRTWLDPTVNVLFAFSATLGEGVGLVIPKANISSESAD